MMVARALHVLGVVLWIGGEALETFVVVPEIRRIGDPAERLDFFRRFERRFARHTVFTLALIIVTGIYMLIAQNAWWRFGDANYWWLHGMILVWSICFVYVLFVDRLWFMPWFERTFRRDSDRAFRAVLYQHWALLGLGLLTLVGAVAGSHGAMIFS